MIRVKPVKLMEEIYTSIDLQDVEYLTKNLTPGETFYGEQLYQDEEGNEYRAWTHQKSKLASGMMMGMRIPALREGSKVLYLGASTGTTVSHVSDVVGNTGKVYAVEFSPRSMRDLMNLAMKRENIIPILADARHPYEYAHLLSGVDVLYCDVAQPNQSELMLSNARAFLKTGGMGYIAIKTKSISQRERSNVVFDKEKKILDEGGFEHIKSVSIHKIHKEHFVYLGKWK
ncbi:MAG: fibrillarin-like rRNA/tRNA 2'-O-methyltransferase [Candidatus Heimdallarchaeota archaeon]|nr:fibrillarin-like rRNA/tRNA 2'-O-methyltransferase [Candidatus Heimdallarchaeota archaeon]